MSHAFQRAGPMTHLVPANRCERFSYYGLRAVLVIYLTEELGFGENEAVAAFAYTSALAYFMPLVGGYVADAYLGRFTTILAFSSVYAVGSACLALAAALKSSGLTMFGLFLIGVGTGGIKPCVSAFGGWSFSCWCFSCWPFSCSCLLCARQRGFPRDLLRSVLHSAFCILHSVSIFCLCLCLCLCLLLTFNFF